MREKLVVVYVLSFLLLTLFVNKANAVELVRAEWLHQSVNDQGEVLGQNVVGENSLNLFIVFDSFVPWSDLWEYAQKESKFFLDKVAYKKLYNIIIIQADDLIFYKENQYGRPFSSARPVITSLIKRDYGDNDFLAYVNNFSGVGNFIITGYDNFPEESLQDGRDWRYITTSLATSLKFGIAHEAGHLIGNFPDENFALGKSAKWQLDYLISKGGLVEEIGLYGSLEYISTGDIINGEIVNVNIVDIPKEKIPWAPFITKTNIPLPTTRIPSIIFGEIEFGPLEEFRNDIGVFGFHNILYTTKPGGCIMDAPPSIIDYGYCFLHEQSWAIQALVRTREVNLSSEPGSIISSQGLNISLINTGDERQIHWLVNGVTDSSLSQKTNWTPAELASLNGKSLTLRGINQTAKNYLIDNPYNKNHTNIGGLPLEPARNIPLVDIYSESYSYQIATPIPPTATPVPPTNTPVMVATNNPTPIPLVPSNLISELNSNVLELNWSLDLSNNPVKFNAHLYRNGLYFEGKEIQGSERSTSFVLKSSGSYEIFLRSEFEAGKVSDWVKSELVTYTEPTPTSIPTITPVPPTNTPVPPTFTPTPNNGVIGLSWTNLPYFGAGIGQTEKEVGDDGLLIQADNSLRVIARDGEVATFLPIGTTFLAEGLIEFSVHIKTGDIGSVVDLALIETDEQGNYVGPFNHFSYPILKVEDRIIYASIKIQSGKGIVPLLQFRGGSGEFTIEFRDPTLSPL